MEKIVIGLGNTGTVIVRELAKKNISNVKLFAIDSQVKHVSIDNVSKVKYIPIVADDNVGSGRDRDRGRAMFEYNLEEHNMDELFDMCQKTDTIFVVSSAAGGTGSGSCPKLCEALFDRLNEDVKIIPIIVCAIPRSTTPFPFVVSKHLLAMARAKHDVVFLSHRQIVFIVPESSRTSMHGRPKSVCTKTEQKLHHLGIVR